MPRKSTTTIEIPTALLKAIIRHDSLSDAAETIERIGEEHDGKEMRDLRRQSSHLLTLHLLMKDATTRRAVAPNDDELLATFVQTLLVEMCEEAFWEFVVNHRDEARAKLEKLTLDEQRLGFRLQDELSLDIFDLDLDNVLELTLAEFGIHGTYDMTLGLQVDRMLHSFLYADINYKGEIV